jgi:hypothetical protein
MAQVEQDTTFQENQSFQSLDSTAMQKLNKMDSLTLATDQKIDSLNLLTYNNKIDSIRGHLSFSIDSLNSLQLPTEKYTRLLDSLNRLSPSHSLNQARQRVTTFQSKVSDMEGKVNSPSNKVEQVVNEKLNLMKREGGEGANLPGNLDLPGVDAPGAEGIPSLDLGLNENQQKMPGIPGVGLPSLGGVPAFDELNNAQQGLGEVTKVTGEVAAYSEDVKNISSGNLNEVKKIPQTLESEAVKAVDAGELTGQMQVVDQYKGVLANGNDPEALKKEALQLAPKMAANHFKGKEVVLQEAINKVNSYKKKYTELTDLENIPKRKPNAMKDKPLIERLVPGMTFQIQKSENVWLDYNPSLSYLISGRFVAGLGWNERISITNHFGFTSTGRIYGPRTFLEVKIKKGFSVRADVEKMYAFVPPNVFSPTDLGGNRWVGSAFIGMKKQYDFMKSIKGNFQFLYNFYDDHDNSPYTSRFNVRFGFEFPMKKKVKENIEPPTTVW